MQWRDGVATLATGAVLAAAVPGGLHASCSREDVDYFLGRGFTTEQVVLLCGQGTPLAAQPGTAGLPAPGVQEGEPPALTPLNDADRGARDLLLRSIAARHIHIDGESLAWTVPACVEYAPPNLADRPREVCGTVQYRIARDGLELRGAERRILFFGQRGWLVGGAISQTWTLPLDTLAPADQRRVAERTARLPTSLLLPIHETAALAEVEQALRALVREGGQP